jgi:hypothetical protein
MTGVDPFLMRRFVLSGADEVFHLHLFKLTRAKDEITGRDFVAKRFADLGDPEWQLTPAGVEHVKKVYEDALRSFGTKIDQRVRVVFRGGADVRFEHQIERPGFGDIL